MKKMISSCLLGLGLLAIGGCSDNNGTASTQSKANVVVKDESSKANVVVKDEFNTGDLKKIEYIADTKNSLIGRHVDCKAGMTIYTHGNGISVVPSSQINQDLIKEKCE